MTKLIDILYDLTARQLGVVAVLLFLIATIAIRQKNTIKYPSNLPRVGEPAGKTRFSLRTRLAWYTDCEKLYQEAYNTYSKNGRSCLVAALGCRDEVILPSSSLRWATSKPDSVLSVYDALREVDQLEYTAGHHKYITNPWQGLLVKRDINAVLESIVVGLNDELGYSFDTRFGTDKNWKELNLHDTMRMIVAQGSSRFTVGLPLCRNEEYLETTVKFPDHFMMTAGLVGAFPKFMRPIIGALFYVPNFFHLRKTARLLKPTFDERLTFTLANPKSEKDPQDHLQMMLREAQQNYPDELTLREITNRVAMSNMGSYHQTTIALTNIMFDILQSDPEFNTIAVLREEIRSIIGANTEWTKAKVSKMVRCDSVLRESLRLHSLGKRSIMRQVKVDGLVTEDGITLPKGCYVSIFSLAGVDGERFEDPEKFDPFRFSRQRENAAPEVPTGNLSFVTTGIDNLAFGHGKHACPGRFLVDFEMKMTLAYVLNNYDLAMPEEYKGKRPKSEWLAEAMMPPAQGRIRIRRREI